MTKEEKIKEAWGEYYEQNKDSIDENGFMLGNYKSYPNIKFDVEDFTYLQPKSLKGIENNNGWTKIESEDWLKETRIDGSTVRYYVDNIEDDYFDISVQINDEEKSILGLSDYLFIKEELDKDGINPTHYQPIEKPLKPLY